MSSAIENPQWNRRALCRNHKNPELWFPDRADKTVSPALRRLRTREASTICQMCPVFFACREQAIRNSEAFGVWAGEDLGSVRGRRRIVEALPRIPSPEMVELYSDVLCDYDRRVPHENGPLTV